MGIEVLICGGIDGINKAFFEEKGILVIDNAMGEAMGVLANFLGEMMEGNKVLRENESGKGCPQRTEGN